MYTVGQNFISFAVTNVSGGVYTSPVSGFTVHAVSNGDTVSGSTVAAVSGDTGAFRVSTVLSAGDFSVRLTGPNAVVSPSVVSDYVYNYSTDEIYSRFLQSASIPNKTSSFSSGSWYAVAGFDDVEVQFIVSAPSAAYGGNGTDITGYTFTSWAPNISGGTNIGTVTVVSVPSCELQLNIPHANLPTSLVSGTTSNYTIDIRGTSGTGKQVTVYKLTLYLTTS